MYVGMYVCMSIHDPHSSHDILMRLLSELFLALHLNVLDLGVGEDVWRQLLGPVSLLGRTSVTGLPALAALTAEDAHAREGISHSSADALLSSLHV